MVEPCFLRWATVSTSCLRKLVGKRCRGPIFLKFVDMVVRGLDDGGSLVTADLERSGRMVGRCGIVQPTAAASGEGNVVVIDGAE